MDARVRVGTMNDRTKRRPRLELLADEKNILVLHDWPMSELVSPKLLPIVDKVPELNQRYIRTSAGTLALNSLLVFEGFSDKLLNSGFD